MVHCRRTGFRMAIRTKTMSHNSGVLGDIEFVPIGNWQFGPTNGKFANPVAIWHPQTHSDSRDSQTPVQRKQPSEGAEVEASQLGDEGVQVLICPVCRRWGGLPNLMCVMGKRTVCGCTLRPSICTGTIVGPSSSTASSSRFPSILASICACHAGADAPTALRRAMSMRRGILVAKVRWEFAMNCIYGRMHACVTP